MATRNWPNLAVNESVHVGYLATLRKDGSPHVHPMTPFVGEGHLFFFSHVGSFFWRDLQRDSRYALHCSVEDQYGGKGEFFIKGNAVLTDDPDLRVIADKYVPYTDDLDENSVLFELSIESAFSNFKSVRQRWKMNWGSHRFGEVTNAKSLPIQLSERSSDLF